jgi:hypothetical protein
MNRFSLLFFLCDGMSASYSLSSECFFLCVCFGFDQSFTFLLVSPWFIAI